MRSLSIGDIHGGLKALLQCLEKCQYNYKKDKLIFLGDYADGWSQTSELVQYLIELQKEADNKHIFIRGNHDDWLEEWLRYGQGTNMWLTQGGQASYDSYIRTQYFHSTKGEEHKKFFRNLHNYYIDDQNRGFVHGGFVSRKGLGHDTYQANYYWDRDMWQLAMLLEGREELGNNKSLRFKKHFELYIGHTATTSFDIKPHYKEYKDKNQLKNGAITVPMNRCNVWNLDTGAGFSGKLTIMDIDSKQYWQSDYVKDLYPEEKGR